MKDAQLRFVESIRNLTLPDDPMQLLDPLIDDEGIFYLQENTYFDYKREFPFSLSDDYFAGVARLVCAFHNTYGGIIIFGVHDEKRTPGHNPVRVDIEKFNSVLAEKLNAPVECIHRSYDLSKYDSRFCETNKSNAIDLIIVPKRPIGRRPVRFSQKISSYPENVIYFRQGHQVLVAKSQNLKLLYGHREDYGIYDSPEDDHRIPAQLPPSPATVKEFVGRTDVMDKLFTWLVESDEPRTYLYGQGGSGKSTIAHEFARILADQGATIKMNKTYPIDHIIFLSSKELKLQTARGTIERFENLDFTNKMELLKNILMLSGWIHDEDHIDSMGEKDLESEVCQLLEIQCLLLVIDDIDTLTTRKIETGSDFLYKAMIRAKRGGKVLYTLRNVPAQSLANSIEVPGLRPNGEYEEFVKTCCSQFGVPEPDPAVVGGELAQSTERRPLAVETVVGLRRTSGNFDRAIEFFKSKGGDSARSYLFQREYDALSHDDRSRHLLAALSEFGQPVTFGDLEAVLQFDDEQLRDAISEVNEMFLQIDEEGDDSGIPSFSTDLRRPSGTFAFR